MLNKKIQDIQNPFFLKYKEQLLSHYESHIINEFYIPLVPLTKQEIQGLTKRNLPILLVTGKIDSFSPDDSLYPFIKNYSRDAINKCIITTKLSTCYYIEASRANFSDIDYNHFDLLLYKNVERDLFKNIREWMDL